MTYEHQYTAALGRDVLLRPGTTDRNVWNDTFGGAGGYHVPPVNMPIPSTVLDLGANIGLTAAHYRQAWPNASVVAVEPDRGNCQMARLNTDATILEVAAAGEYGDAAFDDTGGEWGYRLDPDGAARVSCVPMSWIIDNSFGVGSSVDFCKMDIEGGEWAVFGDGENWADRVHRLLVELHPGPGIPNDTNLIVERGIEWLTALGYYVEPHLPHPRALWAKR